MSSSPNQCFNWVWVLTEWIQVSIWVLARFKSQYEVQFQLHIPVMDCSPVPLTLPGFSCTSVSNIWGFRNWLVCLPVDPLGSILVKILCDKPVTIMTLCWGCMPGALYDSILEIQDEKVTPLGSENCTLYNWGTWNWNLGILSLNVRCHLAGMAHFLKLFCHASTSILDLW